MRIYIRAGYAWRLADTNQPFVAAYIHKRCMELADYVINFEDGIFTLVKSRHDRDLKDAIAFSYGDMIEVINKIYARDVGYDSLGARYGEMYTAGKVIATYSFTEVEEVDELINEIMRTVKR